MGHTKTYTQVLKGVISNIVGASEQIDALFLSHIHDDHIGGLSAALNAVPVGVIYSPVSEWNSTCWANMMKYAKGQGTPIVVLINKGSASASEILSGALKDYHLAYLVGQRTYGKGSVQTVWPFSKTDGVKMTIARYYTPTDVNIDKIGIPPDREILFPVLSEEGEKQYLDLMKSSEISKYVEKHGSMSESDIASYAKTLKKTYKDIDDASLRKLVRNEVNRTKGTMLYDLDYDVQLNEAISILTKENFSKLVKKTKTLKELQDAALLAESKDSGKK